MDTACLELGPTIVEGDAAPNEGMELDKMLRNTLFFMFYDVVDVQALQ